MLMVEFTLSGDSAKPTISRYLALEVTLRNQVELVAPTFIASANWSLQVFKPAFATVSTCFKK